MPDIIPDIPSPTPDSGGQVVGAVGHLISAALQTAGFMFQNDIIRNFGGFLQNLGLLLYVAALVSAIATYALYGNSKQIRYLLICVPLFISVVFYTIPAKPTLLQVGERINLRAQRDQLTVLQEISGRDFTAENIHVSWFFAKFDYLTSAVVQTLVGFLIDENRRRDLVAVAREKIVGDVFSKQPVEQEFLTLLGAGLMAECSRYAFLKKEMSSIDLQLANPITQGPKVPRLQSLKTSYQDEITALKDIRRPIDESLADYVWAVDQGTVLAGRSVALTCDEIWGVCWNRAQQLADEELQKATYAGVTDANGIPWGNVRDDVVAMTGGTDPQEAVRVIAANFVRIALKNLPTGMMLERAVSHSPIDAAKYELTFGAYARAEAQGEFLQMQFFAGVIPYIQGFLLFLMAASFPFFALLILIPGRASGFFAWLGIWVWVKSWDVGFAAIHVVRDFLWEYLSAGVRPTTTGNWADLSFLYTAINSNDPLSNLTMYYLIVSLLTLSVPMLSAHLCLGGRAAFDVFRNAIDETALKVQSRGAKAAKRNVGDMAEAKAWERDTKFGVQAARDAAKRDGGGRTFGTGLRPVDTGDGKLARRQRGEGDAAQNAFHFSKQAIQQRGILGMIAGRPISHSGSGSVSLPDSQRITDLQAEPHETRSMYQSHNNPLAGVLQDESVLVSQKSNNPSTSTGARPAFARDIDN